LLLALALLMVVDWLVDLGLGIAWLGFVAVRDAPASSRTGANFRGHSREFSDVSDANDLFGGQQKLR
jgi:hypothetical protein